MKAYKITSLLAVFASLALGAGSLFAEDPKPRVEASDEAFVKSASQAGIGEVQVAALAVKKGARADVKELAEKLVTAHTAMNTEISALAKSKNVAISTVTDPSDTETLKDLENTNTGDNFDKAFLAELESSHKDSIALYEDAAEDAKDAEVKNFAAKALPELKAHLEMIQTAQKK